MTWKWWTQFKSWFSTWGPWVWFRKWFLAWGPWVRFRKWVLDAYDFAEDEGDFEETIIEGPCPFSRKEVNVELSELSGLWLKYNEGFSPQKVTMPFNVDAMLSGEEMMGAPEDLEEPEEEDESGMPEILMGTPSPPAPFKFLQTDLSALSLAFVKDVLTPHNKEVLANADALDGIHRMIKLLDGEGTCPSLVQKDGDDQAGKEWRNVAKIMLMHVTLREHTFQVARYAISSIQEMYKDWEPLLALTLVATLGHDLGKLPSLRKDPEYAKANHPVLSQRKVREIFKDLMTEKNTRWLESAIIAIEDHHEPTEKDPSKRDRGNHTYILRNADHTIRELEVAAKTGKTVKKWDDWFSPKSLLDVVMPLVNVTQTGNAWKAFSYGGSIYCDAETLYDCTKKLAESLKVMDMSVANIYERESVEKRVIDALREAEATAPALTKGRYGVEYEINCSGQGLKAKTKRKLVPLKIEAFGVLPSKVEENQGPQFRGLTLNAA